MKNKVKILFFIILSLDKNDPLTSLKYDKIFSYLLNEKIIRLKSYFLFKIILLWLLNN